MWGGVGVNSLPKTFLRRPKALMNLMGDAPNPGRESSVADYFFFFSRGKLNSRNVYIWQHFHPPQKMTTYGSILTQKKTQMCIYGTILTQKKTKFFSSAEGCVKNVYIWHHFDPAPKKKIVFACGCVKNPGFSQKFSACGGPKQTMAPLPQNMHN